MNGKNSLTESSISRTYNTYSIMTQHLSKGGFRDNAKDTTKCMPDHKVFARKLGGNKQLKAVLLNSYGVTSVDGTYIEDFGTDALKVKEDSSLLSTLMTIQI